MSDNTYWSPVIIGVFSGLLGVIITSAVNLIIATLNRKNQNKLTIRELELKEKIEYHKIAIEHLMNKVRYLNEWTIEYIKINEIENIFELYNNSEDKDIPKDTIIQVQVLLTNIRDNLEKISTYLSGDKLISLFDMTEKTMVELEKNISSNNSNDFKRNAINYLKDCRTFINIEVSTAIKKIDKLIGKYIE
ncbi:MAG: hypothetical protein KA140_01945 [Caldisericia bacterium]|nr:hypothetical protein [Caldisericia bacterium]